MMHNSLLIRDRLRLVNADPLHRTRRDPHRWLHVDGLRTAAPDELLLEGRWSIVAASTLTGVAEVSEDLSDLLTRFDLELAPVASQQISFTTDATLAHGGFRLDVQEEAIDVRAGTTEGLWAGLVYLERQMALRRAPILPRGVTERQPTWPVQISQAPYGANYLVPDLSPEYLSDDAFRMLAHYGITGMTIYGDWLCYVQSTLFPELNHPDYARNIAVLRDAAQRAQRYGVQLYYVPVSPKLVARHPVFEHHPTARGSRIFPGLSPTSKSIHCLCSSDPESLAFHGEVLGNLFKEVPELGGLILIVGGESYYHCFMRPDKRGLPEGVKTNCPRCAAHRPEEAVNRLLAATAAGVHAYRPDAWVMAWPYSAFIWSSDPQQLELVRELPPDVPLLTTIDKDQWMPKADYQKLIWDYSIDYTGPADNILAQAAIIEERKLPLFVKTETALGLECIQFPYMPSLQRLAEKWVNVRALRPTGVLQSWMFFGMWGSRAEELGWWARWCPETPVNVVLAQIAQRDFGTKASQVVAAWNKISEAVGHLPYIPPYFTGPEFVGPAHPLFFDAAEPVPELFSALLYYLQENEETFSTAVTEVRQSLVMNELPHAHVARAMRVEGQEDVWNVAVREYEEVVAAARQAFELLSEAQTSSDKLADAMLADELVLTEAAYRTWLTTLHSIRFLRCRERLAVSGEEACRQEMIDIARRELDNTRSARHVFVEAPWLDLSLRVDGQFPASLDMIDTKIALLEQSLNRHTQ